MSNLKKLRFVKSCGIISAIIMITCWFIDGYMQNHYVDYPREVLYKSGNLVPYHVKGIIVYITKSQSYIMDLLLYFEVVSGVFFLGFFVYYKYESQNKSDRV